MSDNQEQQKQDRLNVLLALALERRQPQTPCPDGEELAAWHEGRLSGERVAELTEHLAECDECYELWLDLGDSVDALDSLESLPWRPGTEVEKSTTRWDAFVTRLGKIFVGRPHVPRPVLLGGGFGGALVLAAALALVVVLLPGYRLDSLNSEIDAGFSRLPTGMHGPLRPASQSAMIVKSFDLLASLRPWKPETAAQHAFALGVREGLLETGGLESRDQRLVEQLPSTLPADTGPAGAGDRVSERVRQRHARALRLLGRWTVLVRRACNQQPEIPPDFFAEQRLVGERLGREIVDSPVSDEFSDFFSRAGDGFSRAGDGGALSTPVEATAPTDSGATSTPFESPAPPKSPAPTDPCAVAAALLEIGL